MKKEKIYRFSRKYISAGNVRLLILLVPLAVLLVKQIGAGAVGLETFLDTGVLVSFIFVFISEILAGALAGAVCKKYEDAGKLTEDYASLVRKYAREKLIVYKGNTLPVICLCLRKSHEAPFRMEIENSRGKYVLPSQIADKSDYLMKAHKYSTIYNNMNIRLDDIEINGGALKLCCSMTTYFDSLITNRAMDYKLENGKTIREIYEPGPFLSRLRDSRLSNHLGFNGFVELRDGEIIFVSRSSNASIGKNTLANSIGASMKAKYALDDDRRLSVEGIGSAIRKEICDELRIAEDETANIDMTKAVFAFYRDILEGGKPQFLFYIKLNRLNRSQFESNFRSDLRGNKKQQLKNGTIDGTKFVYLTLPELSLCDIRADRLVLPNGRAYRMLPSASASVIMLLRHLGGAAQTE